MQWRHAVWAILAELGWSRVAIGALTGHDSTTVRDAQALAPDLERIAKILAAAP